MLAHHRSAGVAVAIAAIMVLSTLAGATALSPHGPAGSFANPTQRSASASSTALLAPAAASALPSGAAMQLSTPSANSLPANPATPAAAGTSALTGRAVSTVNTLRSDGVPLQDAFLPNLNANPHPSLSSYGTVVPGYGPGPAPIGVAEYGVFNESGVLVPENLSTTLLVASFIGENPFCEDFTGNCTPSVLSMDTGTPDAYGLQLNAVLQNVTLFNTPGYEFWTQNVIEYSTFSHQLYIITNIWNFSSPALLFTPNSIISHGPNGTEVPGELYYSVSGPFNISSNYTAILSLESYVNGTNDEVVFDYELANATEFFEGVNDYAVFNSSGAAGPGVATPAEYVASGSTYTPLGIPSDWEFVMGGPGGGSNVDLLSMYSEMDLYYETPLGGIAVVPSAMDVGSETGETSVGGTALWEGDWSPFIGDSPGVFITPGPFFESGLWNVTNTTQGFGVIGFGLYPANAFNFFGQTADPFAFEQFEWAPSTFLYFLPPATYTVWSLASNYEPGLNGFIVTNGSEQLIVTTLSWDPFTGVYTPLWAVNQTDLSTITWDGYTLFNNQYGALGEDQENGIYFPWFGEFNDYTFPVFAGILLWNTFDAQIVAPSSLLVDYPSWYLPFLDYHGLPVSNNLPILVYDSYFVTLAGASAISGWWFTSAFFGPTAPQYNVVFWNVSDSLIENNQFLTGGNALFLYGGTDNEIFNNTFLQDLPNAPDLFAISGYYFGTYALLEADFGDYAFGGDYCDCWDLVYNNLFDTYFTALSPEFDPYTGNFPILPFSEEWNIPRENGQTNIIGGDYLGGNYWWNYGTSDNPYGVLPYDNFQLYYLFLWGLDPFGIPYAGDYVPLTLSPLYVVTFEESGLPAGTFWSPTVLASDDGFVYNYTDLTFANESWPAGEYFYGAVSDNASFVYSGSTVLFVFGDEIINVTFVPLIALSFHESGLPVGSDWGGFYEGGSFNGSNGSNTTWLNFSVPAGTYFYEVFADGEYAAPDGSGIVNVSGPTVVDVTFVPLYTVTFDESGLPLNGSWTIIFTTDAPEGGSGSVTVNSSSNLLGFALSGYTYDWWVVAPGFVATPASGSFLLEANETVTVVFAAVESITFDESGLTAGSAWTVVLTQGASVQTVTSTGTSITFSGMAGAYSYSVSAAGWVPGIASGGGTLPVGGPITVDFTPAAATVVFDASGLPAGTSWTVTLTQGATVTEKSGTGALSFSGVYGAYSYTTSAANFTAAPASGSGVLPSDTPVAIGFTPTPATIVFSETGLASGAPWTVAFTQNAVTSDYTGNGASITIHAVDGPYSYAVTAENYSATPASGPGGLPVDDAVSVTFAVVDGTLQGTVLPATATLTVGATVETLGVTGTFSVDLAPGTYAVKVTDSGYYPYYTNVTVASDKTTTLTVTLKSIPSTPKPLLGVSGSSGWLLIGALALLVVILLGTTLLFMRRSRQPPQMAPYSGATPPKGAGGAPGNPEWSESNEPSGPAGKS